MYKKGKDKKNLLARMKLSIIDKQYLHVYIWKTNDAMRLNYDYEGGYAAAYCGLPSINGNIGNKFGEIHLVEGEFGGGIFAHELQHFIIDWMGAYNFKYKGKQIEKICLMAGNMTNRFWTWFYANGFDNDC